MSGTWFLVLSELHWASSEALSHPEADFSFNVPSVGL